MQVTDYGVVHEEWRSAAIEDISPSLWSLKVHLNVLIWAGNVSTFSERYISIFLTHLCPNRTIGLFPDGCPTWSLRFSSPHTPRVLSWSWSLSFFFPFCSTCSYFHFRVTTSLSREYIPRCCPWGIISQWACRYVRDQVSYSLQTSRKVTLVCILIVSVSDRRKTKESR
jgi:hypothetical protein